MNLFQVEAGNDPDLIKLFFLHGDPGLREESQKQPAV